MTETKRWCTDWDSPNANFNMMIAMSLNARFKRLEERKSPQLSQIVKCSYSEKSDKAMQCGKIHNPNSEIANANYKQNELTLK